MSASPIPDWEAYIQRHAAAGVPELALASLKRGDRLLVLTQNTAYQFVMLEDRVAMLSTGRTDRPTGQVRINGCTFGASSTIKPDHLFCGGNVEFTHGEPPRVYTTTSIRALQLLQSSGV